MTVVRNDPIIWGRRTLWVRTPGAGLDPAELPKPCQDELPRPAAAGPHCAQAPDWSDRGSVVRP
eukprot:11041474-Alexandrium_andersonii.AAC.1